ncbi:MAG TPA: VOC family protein [Nocardioidaceae bacterium]
MTAVMHARRKIFVNLPVNDLADSVAFFSKLGFRFNPEFTDEQAACMVVSDDAFVMLLPRDFYASFTTKSVVDSTTHNEVILAISADSRDEVDRLVARALESGGAPSAAKIVDGPMYGWSFADVDGHLWEVLYMDPADVAR